MSSDKLLFLEQLKIESIHQDHQAFFQKLKFNDIKTNQTKPIDVKFGRFRNGLLPRRYRQSVENQIPPKYPPKCPKSQPKISSVFPSQIYFTVEKNGQKDLFNQVNQSNLLDDSLLSQSILMGENRIKISQIASLQNPYISALENESPKSLEKDGNPEPSPIVEKNQSFDSGKSMAENMKDMIKQSNRGKACEFILADELSNCIEKYVMSEEKLSPIENCIQSSYKKGQSYLIEKERKKPQDFDQQINDYLLKIVGVVKEIAEITESNQIGDQENLDEIEKASKIIQEIMSITSSTRLPLKITSSQNSLSKMDQVEKCEQNKIQLQTISPQKLVQKSIQQANPQINLLEITEIINLCNQEVKSKQNSHFKKIKNIKLEEKAIQVQFEQKSVDKSIQTVVPMVRNQSVQVSVKKSGMKIQNVCSQRIQDCPLKIKTQLKLDLGIVELQIMPDEKKIQTQKNMDISQKLTNQYFKLNSAPAGVSRKRIQSTVFSIKIQPKKDEPKKDFGRITVRLQEKHKRAKIIQAQRIEQQISVRQDSENLNRLFWANVKNGPELINQWLPKMRSRQIIELNLIKYRYAVLIQYIVLCLTQYPFTINQRFDDFRKKDQQLIKAFSDRNILIPTEEIQRTKSLLVAIESVIQKLNCERGLDFENL